MKRLSILGSTGSIGKNTLEVISDNPDRFSVKALAARNNIKLLAEQINIFKPELVAVFDEAPAEELRRDFPDLKVLSGGKGLIEAATLDNIDMVVSAIVGSPGLAPTYEAVKAGRDIALATKEALVMAGRIIMSEAAKHNVKILPVDSEHSAIFQCLEGRDIKDLKKIILTASGGSFLRKSAADLSDVTPEDALKHPNWEMGRKITVDSATLMNKGLEVIEAFWLFGVPLDKIGVIIHPQSIIHSMVEFIDGSVIAQLSLPDMKGPIAYALSWPERLENVLGPMDFAKIGTLTFEEPDMEKYRSLTLTFDALKAGGTMPCVLNAANEAAVEAFLNEKIGFTDIFRVISETMDAHEVTEGATIEEVINASDLAMRKADEIIKTISMKEDIKI